MVTSLSVTSVASASATHEAASLSLDKHSAVKESPTVFDGKFPTPTNRTDLHGW